MKKKKSIFGVIPKALVFGMIAGIGFYFLSPKLGLNSYRAQAKILTTQNSNIEKNDNTSYTYAETVNSDAIKNKVIENLKLNTNPAQLDKKLEIKSVDKTHIININVKDNIKLRAEDIADEYADITVAVINNLYKADAKVLDYAYQNGSLIDPSVEYSSRVGLAIFVGYFILGSLFTFIRNSRIDDEKEELVEEKIERRVVFEDEKKDEYDYDQVEEINQKNVAENYENHVNYTKDLDEDNPKEDNYNEEIYVKYDDTKDIEEKIEEEQEVETQQDFVYINENTEDTTRVYENNGKEYKVIADMPKYDDGDLDV